MAPTVSEKTIIAEASPLRESVTVGDIGGGKKTNPLWTSQVSSEDFAETLRQAFTAHTMLSMEDGDYRLDAELVKLKQPLAGFNMTVTADVKYTLTEVATGDVVIDEVISTPYTAKTSDAFIAVERLRLANEGSIRENITQLITMMIERVDGKSDADEMSDEGAADEAETADETADVSS
ncbi:MAG: hypothetical protein AAFQ96_00485 [Pseudomonadota bacterium]